MATLSLDLDPDPDLPVTIGRNNSNTLPIACSSDPEVQRFRALVGRHHVQIVYQPKTREWVLSDCRSVNGVTVASANNRIRLAPGASRVLKSGDIIELANCDQLAFLFEDAGAAQGLSSACSHPAFILQRVGSADLQIPLDSRLIRLTGELAGFTAESRDVIKVVGIRSPGILARVHVGDSGVRIEPVIHGIMVNGLLIAAPTALQESDSISLASAPGFSLTLRLTSGNPPGC